MIDSFEGCIIGGAIGDSWGSSYENETSVDDSKTFYWKKVEKQRSWSITDDTQLTLATCEALSQSDFSPQILSDYFVKYYNEKKLTGLGASTLKATLELQAGAHWSQVGRSGEYAAGNGAAMRIAPLAFFKKIKREDVWDICRITHKNNEAYTGALAIFLSIQAILNKDVNELNNLFDIIIPELPDTRVRDRLIEINSKKEKASINDVAKFGTNGYVVNSVPFSIYAATKVEKIGMKKMFQEIIDAGGDTDTNSLIAGQIAGAFVGLKNIPSDLLNALKALREYEWIQGIVDKTKAVLITEQNAV